jgi:hypothetical protein
MTGRYTPLWTVTRPAFTAAAKAWADRGLTSRAALPLATRSSTVRCARHQADANGWVRVRAVPPVLAAMVASGLRGCTGRRADAGRHEA